MSDENGRFTVSLGAIIESSKTGRILLLKRHQAKDFSAGIWEYPTGRLHQFEEPLDGLRREIMEETGLAVEIVKPLSTFHIYRGERLAENEVVGIMYWCRAETEEVQVSPEHSEYQWVTAAEALAIIEKPSMQADIWAFIREANKAPKLVRDKVPELIRQDGRRPVYHTATAEEYSHAIAAKLLEEVKEFLEKPSINEAADIFELLRAFPGLENLDMEELEQARLKKERECGVFKDKIILESNGK